MKRALHLTLAFALPLAGCDAGLFETGGSGSDGGGTCVSDVFAADGYNKCGYDRNGYDSNGFNNMGLDQNGNSDPTRVVGVWDITTPHDFTGTPLGQAVLNLANDSASGGWGSVLGLLGGALGLGSDLQLVISAFGGSTLGSVTSNLTGSNSFGSTLSTAVSGGRTASADGGTSSSTPQTQFAKVFQTYATELSSQFKSVVAYNQLTVGAPDPTTHNLPVSDRFIQMSYSNGTATLGVNTTAMATGHVTGLNFTVDKHAYMGSLNVGPALVAMLNNAAQKASPPAANFSAFLVNSTNICGLITGAFDTWVWDANNCCFPATYCGNTAHPCTNIQTATDGSPLASCNSQVEALIAKGTLPVKDSKVCPSHMFQPDTSTDSSNPLKKVTDVLTGLVCQVAMDALANQLVNDYTNSMSFAATADVLNATAVKADGTAGKPDKLTGTWPLLLGTAPNVTSVAGAASGITEGTAAPASSPDGGTTTTAKK